MCFIGACDVCTHFSAWKVVWSGTFLPPISPGNCDVAIRNLYAISVNSRSELPREFNGIKRNTMTPGHFNSIAGWVNESWGTGTWYSIWYVFYTKFRSCANKSNCKRKVKEGHTMVTERLCTLITLRKSECWNTQHISMYCIVQSNFHVFRLCQCLASTLKASKMSEWNHLPHLETHKVTLHSLTPSPKSYSLAGLHNQPITLPAIHTLIQGQTIFTKWQTMEAYNYESLQPESFTETKSWKHDCNTNIGLGEKTNPTKKNAAFIVA